MACQKSLAEFYPQGVRGIRKAAEPPAAAPARGPPPRYVDHLSDDMCVGKILCAPQVCEQSECAQRSVSSSKKGHISMPLFWS